MTAHHDLVEAGRDVTETRDGIVAAAVALFAERGFAAIGAGHRRASRVTKGACYHHFDSKNAVVSVPVLVYSWLDVDREVDPARVARLFTDLFLRGPVKEPAAVDSPTRRVSRSIKS